MRENNKAGVLAIETRHYHHARVGTHCTLQYF